MSGRPVVRDCACPPECEHSRGCPYVDVAGYQAAVDEMAGYRELRPMPLHQVEETGIGPLGLPSYRCVACGEEQPQGWCAGAGTRAWQMGRGERAPVGTHGFAAGARGVLGKNGPAT